MKFVDPSICTVHIFGAAFGLGVVILSVLNKTKNKLP